MLRAGVVLAAVLTLPGCMLGPDYIRPQQQVPERFATPDGWKVAAPAQTDSSVDWRQLYQDQELMQLLELL